MHRPVPLTAIWPRRRPDAYAAHGASGEVDPLHRRSLARRARKAAKP